MKWSVWIIKKIGLHCDDCRVASDLYFIFIYIYYTFFTLIRYSAICTAFSAAPFLIWSPTIQNVRPFSFVRSLRIRPTYTGSLPARNNASGIPFRQDCPEERDPRLSQMLHGLLLPRSDVLFPPRCFQSEHEVRGHVRRLHWLHVRVHDLACFVIHLHFSLV